MSYLLSFLQKVRGEETSNSKDITGHFDPSAIFLCYYDNEKFVLFFPHFCFLFKVFLIFTCAIFVGGYLISGVHSFADLTTISVAFAY